MENLFSGIEKPHSIQYTIVEERLKTRANSDHSVIYHQVMIEYWVQAYKQKVNLDPILIPKELKNLKLIRQTLYSIAKEDTPQVFKQILTNWDKLPSWYQANFTLSTMYCKINEILNHLKNGTTENPKRVTSQGLHQGLDQFYRDK